MWHCFNLLGILNFAPQDDFDVGEPGGTRDTGEGSLAPGGRLEASPPVELALRIPHSERDETPVSLED